MTASWALVVAGLVFAGGISTAPAARQGPGVQIVDLPLKLPAVGNLDAVRQWRFGRLQQVQRVGGQPDIVLEIRTGDGNVHRVVGPGPALAELARISNWFDPVKARPGRSDYVERMIAFDVDGQQRLIAMMSLEPVYRDRNRLRRALQP
ncbi:MAG: hypothetical protein ACYS0G_05275 [Planctomycetota bacterium]|jgi:hypothetical protein